MFPGGPPTGAGTPGLMPGSEKVKFSAENVDDASMHDYLPGADADFAAWANHYVDAIKAWWDDHGQKAGDLDPLEAAFAEWIKDWPLHVAAQQAAQAATRTKDESRRRLEAQVRWTAQFVQAFPETTNADRAALGIALRQAGAGQGSGAGSGSRVRGSGFGSSQSKTIFTAERGATRPLVWVESAARLTHVVRFADESSPTRRSKPRGVLGAEVWVALVAAGSVPPSDPAAMQYLALATRPGVTAEFKPGDGGKLAAYSLRWITTTGQRGPWSEIATATVAA